MNDKPETFWSAARDIVAECHAILKPGGVAVFVTKDFVRDRKRVPFSADWVRLCESCGFTLTKWVRASLVTETVHGHLFDGEVVKRTERKSFLRRLAEKKGSPRIDWEDVLFVVKRGGDAGMGVDGVDGSPPFKSSLADGPSKGVREKLGHSMGRGVLGDGYGVTPGQLADLPAGNVDAVVGSPPFSGTEQPTASQSRTMKEGGYQAIKDPTKRDATHIGATAGQLSAMDTGTVDAVVSSPPYAKISSGAGGLNTKPPKHDGQQGGRSASSASQDTDQRYGESEGPLARMECGTVDAVVSSPPYMKSRVLGGEEAAKVPIPPYVELVWHGCYDQSWKGLIVDGAFAHPAKMARGLVRRIFDELFVTGAIRKGSRVVDPFGGIGTTALEGASRGVNVTVCELEPKFVGLIKENIALHQLGWTLTGLPTPRVVQGDSRKLREHLQT